MGEILVPIAVVLAPIIAGFVARILIRLYFEAQSENRVPETVNWIVQAVVNEAEWFGKQRPEALEKFWGDKRDYAISTVQRELNKRGIELELDIVAGLIEQQVKWAFNDNVFGPPPKESKEVVIVPKEGAD